MYGSPAIGSNVPPNVPLPPCVPPGTGFNCVPPGIGRYMNMMTHPQSPVLCMIIMDSRFPYGGSPSTSS